MKFIPAALVILGCFLYSPSAFAGLDAVQWSPGLISRPVTLSETPLEIVKETVSFTCQQIDEKLSCAFSANFEILHPDRTRFDMPKDTAEVETIAAMFGARCEKIAIQINGKPHRYTLTRAETETLRRFMAIQIDADQPARSKEKTENNESRFNPFSSPLPGSGFRLRTKPGQTVFVTVKGMIKSGDVNMPSFDVSANQTRHALLASDPNSNFQSFVYFMAPLPTWAAVEDVEIILQTPHSLQLGGGFIPFGIEHADQAVEHISGWNTVIKKQSRIQKWQGEGEDYVYLTLFNEIPPPKILNGGPVARIGGTFKDAGGFLMGLRYEIAAPPWLLYSIGVETNFSDYMTYVPIVKIATASVRNLAPSMGIGLGAPILHRFDSDNAVVVGIRLETDFQWGQIGIVFPVDFYPSLDKNDGYRWQLSLMGQVSF